MTGARELNQRSLKDPAAAHYDFSVIEYGGLAGGDGALGLVEGRGNFTGSGVLDLGHSWLVAVADFYADAKRLGKRLDGDPVQVAGAEGPRVEQIIGAEDNLIRGGLDLNDIERRACGYSQALALAYGEVVNAGVFANGFARCGNEFAGGIW